MVWSDRPCLYVTGEEFRRFIKFTSTCGEVLGRGMNTPSCWDVGGRRGVMGRGDRRKRRKRGGSIEGV